MCISPRGRKVAIVAPNVIDMNEGNNGLLLNPRLIRRHFLSRGEAEGQKDDELTEGSTANLCCPSECLCQRVAANMATSPELRTPFFATRWRKSNSGFNNM